MFILCCDFLLDFLESPKLNYDNLKFIDCIIYVNFWILFIRARINISCIKPSYKIFKDTTMFKTHHTPKKKPQQSKINKSSQNVSSFSALSNPNDRRINYFVCEKKRISVALIAIIFTYENFFSKIYYSFAHNIKKKYKNHLHEIYHHQNSRLWWPTSKIWYLKSLQVYIPPLHIYVFLCNLAGRQTFCCFAIKKKKSSTKLNYVTLWLLLVVVWLCQYQNHYLFCVQFCCAFHILYVH